MKQALRSSALFLMLTLLTGLSGKESTGVCLTRSTDNPGNDFALTDQDGKPFHLSQLRGKVVLLFFGYTHCPDACPTTMAKLSQVYKLLGRNSDQVMTIFVSVDPSRDTTNGLKS